MAPRPRFSRFSTVKGTLRGAGWGGGRAEIWAHWLWASKGGLREAAGVGPGPPWRRGELRPRHARAGDLGLPVPPPAPHSQRIDSCGRPGGLAAPLCPRVAAERVWPSFPDSPNPWGQRAKGARQVLGGASCVSRGPSAPAGRRRGDSCTPECERAQRH